MSRCKHTDLVMAVALGIHLSLERKRRYVACLSCGRIGWRPTSTGVLRWLPKRVSDEYTEKIEFEKKARRQFAARPHPETI